MTCYSVQTRNRIFVKDYGLLPFPKNLSKSIGKSISKNLVVNTARNLNS